jgi:protein-disulfide isomerase
MNKNTLIFLTVVMVLVGAGFLLFRSTSPSVKENTAVIPPANNNEKTAATTPSQNISDSILPTLGDANAPVTIIEYGHFKCPSCNKFFRETKPEITEKYIKTGKVKFVWKDFP